MENKTKKIDVKTIIITLLAILVVILIMVVINSNKEKYVTLNTSNYSDYLTLATNYSYTDNKGIKRARIGSTGLSSNYNYEDIEITAIVSFKEENTNKIQSEEITFKCRVDGSGFGTTNIALPNYWHNDQVTYTVKNVKGKLILAK